MGQGRTTGRSGASQPYGYKFHLAESRLGELGRRHGNPAEAQKWLAVAERRLRLHRQLVHIIAADDKIDTARIEQPYRLRVLEYRARRPGSTHATRSSPRSGEDERGWTPRKRSGRLRLDAFGAAADQCFGDLLGVERCLRLRVDAHDRLLLADRLAHFQVAQDNTGKWRTEAKEGL